MSCQPLEIKLRINLNGKETLLKVIWKIHITWTHTLTFFFYFSRLDETLKTVMKERKVIIILRALQASLVSGPVAHYWVIRYKIPLSQLGTPPQNQRARSPIPNSNGNSQGDSGREGIESRSTVFHPWWVTLPKFENHYIRQNVLNSSLLFLYLKGKNSVPPPPWQSWGKGEILFKR